MRIGLFGDIHGNLIALDAVLARLEDASPDLLVCLGDIATTGPRPREVIARLRDLKCPAVKGNWDAWMVDVRSGRRPFAGCRAIDRWGAEQLTAADLDYLDALPATIEMALGDQATLLCFHASPRSYDEGIDATTPHHTLRHLLDGRSASVMVGGHTHTQMLRRYDEGFLINPGSISECWNYTLEPIGARFSPWAEFGLLDWTAAGPGLTLRRVAIDVDAVIASAYASGMAGADAWTALWVRPGAAGP